MKVSYLRYTLLLLVSLALLLANESRAVAAPPYQESEGNIHIKNLSDKTICHLFISEVTASDRGYDRLEKSTIPPNSSRVFQQPRGSYNLLLQDCDGKELLYEPGITLSSSYELGFTDSDLCYALTEKGLALYNQAQYPLALQKYEEALTCAQEEGDRAVEGVTLDALGLVYTNLGRDEEALDSYQQALEIWREVGGQAWEGLTLNNLGLVYHDQERYLEALDFIQQALEINREVGYRAGEGFTLNNLGLVYYDQGRYLEALEIYQQALEINREVGDRAGESTTLNNLGALYYDQGHYEEALDSYQQTLEIMREVGDRAGEGTTLNNLGLVYDKQERYLEALDFHEQALVIRREVGDQAGQASTLHSLGWLYDKLGRYLEALEIYQQALEIRREVGDRAGESTTLNNLGALYYDQGRYLEGLDFYQQALEISREVGDRAGEGTILNGLGVVYTSLGRYEEALDFYQQALEISREVDDRAQKGTILNNLGIIYQKQGRYDEVLSFFLQALEISREVGDLGQEAVALNNLAEVYASLGDYDEALDFHEQALEINRKVGNRAIEGALLNNLAKVYYDQGRYDEALDFNLQALEIIRDANAGKRAGEGTIIGNLGEVYASLGYDSEALDFFEQALVISREVGNRVGEGIILNNLGGVYRRQGRYEKALEFYQEALKIIREVGYRAEEGTILKNLGLVYERQGRYHEALAHYQQSIEVIEQIRSDIKVEELKSNFTSEWTSVYVYGRSIDLLIQLERPDEAFGYVQRAKARTFLDQLGNDVRPNPKTIDNPELLARQQRLLSEIRALEEVLFAREELAQLSFDETTRSTPPLTDEQRNEVQAGLEAKRKEYSQLLIEIKITNPEYASLVTVDTLALTEIQQLLPNGTTLVEYYVQPEQTLAFIVTADRFHTEAISVTQQMLFDEINRLDSQSQTTLDSVPSSVQTLYDWLVTPLQAHLSNEKIIIAPHGVLHYVPFAALHDGQQYLIEQHTLTQLPSASILPFVQAKRKENVAQPLILGDADGSLPNARQEAEAIAARYDGVAYVGSQAQEQVLWQQGQQAGIVHLSTHGIYNPLSPTFSRVLLAADAEKQYDGFLEVHEVYNLDLQQADLVVLSACQTNLGQQSRGDEIIGLNRAFIYAGTPSVMATLWSVEDSATKDLMLAFYRYLDEGYSKGDALRQAQIDLLGNPDTAHPHFWAGVVLTGDGGTLTIRKPVPWWARVFALLSVSSCWMGGIYVNWKDVRTNRIMGYVQNQPRYVTVPKYSARARTLAKWGMIAVPVLVGMWLGGRWFGVW